MRRRAALARISKQVSAQLGAGSEGSRLAREREQRKLQRAKFKEEARQKQAEADARLAATRASDSGHAGRCHLGAARAQEPPELLSLLGLELPWASGAACPARRSAELPTAP